MSRQNRHNFFNFSHKERLGTIVLMVVISLGSAAPFVAGFFQKKTLEKGVYQNEIASLSLQIEESKKQTGWKEKQYETRDKVANNLYDAPGKKALQLFYFDPNTIKEDGWRKMGLNEKTIKTLCNYVNKGGKFRTPEDIRKIWGLSAEEAEQMIPWIKIAAPPETEIKHYEKREYIKPEIVVLDINEADSAAWESLPGIGPKLSQRIVNYRNKLGGFHSIQQVGETFGLPDSTFQFIKNRLRDPEEPVKKININTASLDDLKSHPYIRYHLANAIVQYRTQHGNYKALTDVLKIMIVDDEVYSKILPYITLE